VEDVRENVRVRLWLGPNTNALLSTNGQFKAMGFDRTQIGERVGKKFQIEGDEGMGHYKLEAYNPPQFVIPKESLKNILRIDLKIAEQVFITNNRSLKIKKKDSFKNANYATLLKEGLVHFFEDTNTMVDVSYDDKGKKFKFIFPPNQNILQTSVMLTRDLAERLGFGLVDSISQANAQGNRVEDDIDVKRTGP
jgi:dissimilatory sulfite reductase (desulfoviridin) alpha/beta subunit